MSTISLIIPTNRDEATLRPCLEALSQQDFPLNRLEVAIVFNGLSSETRTPELGDWPFDLKVDRIEQASICAAKNRALEMIVGDWVILLNDDTICESDFVNQHLVAHDALDQPAMVLGNSAWRRYEDETVFDRMINTTSMVFFYDRLKPHTWYNFRHAWNLNLSLRRHYFDDVRFEERLAPVNFDDLEWAFRIQQTHGLKVWYHPDAESVHDHRYTLDSYLRREGHLARMAVKLWQYNPACFEAIYSRPLDEAFVDYARRYVETESRHEAELLDLLTDRVERYTADWVGEGADADRHVRLLYHTHLPLKRLTFRRSLINAIDALDTNAPPKPARQKPTAHATN